MAKRLVLTVADDLDEATAAKIVEESGGRFTAWKFVEDDDYMDEAREAVEEFFAESEEMKLRAGKTEEDFIREVAGWIEEGVKAYKEYEAQRDDWQDEFSEIVNEAIHEVAPQFTWDNGEFTSEAEQEETKKARAIEQQRRDEEQRREEVRKFDETVARFIEFMEPGKTYKRVDFDPLTPRMNWSLSPTGTRLDEGLRNRIIDQLILDEKIEVIANKPQVFRLKTPVGVA